VDRQAYVDLDYNTQINADLGLELRGFHHWYNYHGDEASEVKGQRVINYDATNSRWWGGEIKLTGTQFDHHKWVAGLEVQKDQQQQQLNYDIKPFLSNLSVNNHGWRAGVYAQDEYRITDSLLLNVGLRLDYSHMIKKLQLNPRVGLIWDATPTFTGKLLYSSAFRAPNAFERDYINEPRDYKNNPGNTEELIKSYEAIAEWRPGNGLKLLSTVFYNNLQHVLEYNYKTGHTKNTGHYHTYGFELGTEKRWDNGRQVKFSWTHNYTRDEELDGDNWAIDSPKNLVKLHYAEPFLDDTVRLGFEEIFVDQRRTLSGNNTANSYHLLNINLSLAKPLYGFQPTLGIYNVLDQHYQVLSDGDKKGQDTLAMDGRTVRFRLEYGF
jgi:outer membrane receptor for ferrienterochelin and colicins